MTLAMKKRERRLAHGGRVALHIVCACYDGQTALERHVAALCDALEGYAERELLPVAAAALEACVHAGRGYTFCPHRYTISVKQKQRGGRRQVTLTATHAQGEQVLSHRTLRMCWSADGALQYRMRNTKKE